MPCRRCQRLALWGSTVSEEDPRKETKHHSTYAELQRAVREGCQVCKILRMALLEEYAHKLHCSPLEVEAYHLYLDRVDRVAHKVHGKRRGAFRRRSARPKKLASSQTGFCVRLRTLDCLVPPSERLTGSLKGIDYRRKRDGCPRHPVSSVSAYLGLSSSSAVETTTGLPILGRTISVTADISLAKSWIHDCVTNHPLCSAPPLMELPTRVIDLQPSTTSQQIRLIHGKGTRAEYATLSHCWGGSQPLQLTSSTIQQFQTNIAFATLPKTFQDAVSSARALGFKYLWIDSLCIIQDSKSDWENECAKMVDIFKNATVTIAGPAATNCDSGFLHEREPQKHEIVNILLKGIPNQVVLSRLSEEQHGSYMRPERNSTWSTRAWILQERLLSRRILYFGSDKMYFECATNVRLETYHLPIYWAPLGCENETRKCSFSQFQRTSELFGYWASVVKSYSKSLLTVKQDRLPALSGIASDIQKINGSQYLAGIWKDDLLRGLLWQTSFYDGKNPLKPFSGYIAPSWSWASNPGPTKYKIRLPKARLRAGLEVLDLGITLAGKNPFGEVQDAFLKIRGQVRDFVVVREKILPITDWQSFDIHDTEGNRLGSYHPDYWPGTSETRFCVTLLYIGHSGHLFGGLHIAMGIQAEVGRPGTYRRVGLTYQYQGDGHGKDEEYHLGKYFKDVERTVLRLI